MQLYEKYIKRLLDIILSSLALIVLTPVLLIVSVLVRVNLGSPIIFKQKRSGKNEKIFTIYKFRTMLDKKNKQGEIIPDSLRITKFGKILRASSLDELPELVNILKGDMSIVGPRPLHVHYLPLYNDEQKLRHCTKPGLTGLAQINGRNSISWEEKFEWDIRYVKNISFLNDLKIILKTFNQVLRKDGINSTSETTMPAFKGTKK